MSEMRAIYGCLGSTGAQHSDDKQSGSEAEVVHVARDAERVTVMSDLIVILYLLFVYLTPYFMVV